MWDVAFSCKQIMAAARTMLLLCATGEISGGGGRGRGKDVEVFPSRCGSCVLNVQYAVLWFTVSLADMYNNSIRWKKINRGSLARDLDHTEQSTITIHIVSIYAYHLRGDGERPACCPILSRIYVSRSRHPSKAKAAARKLSSIYICKYDIVGPVLSVLLSVS